MTENFPPFWKTLTRKLLRDVFSLALLGAGYWLTVWAGLRLVAEARGVLFAWPASGVALGSLLLGGKERWGKMLAAFFLSQTVGLWLMGDAFLPSAALSLASLLEVVFGAWALLRFANFQDLFQRATEVIALFAVAIFCVGAVSALPTLFPFPLYSSALEGWLSRWTSHGLGIILMTPLVVLWDFSSKSDFLPVSKKRLPELALFVLVLTGFALLLFGPFTSPKAPLLRNYMLFPLLIWAAFRFSARDMANFLFLYSAIALWNTLKGHGIFGYSLDAPINVFPALPIYLSIAAFSGLLLSAMVGERRNAEQVLAQNQRMLAAFIARSPIYAFIKAVTPKESRVLYASDNYVDMIGVPPAQMIGKTMRELFPSEFADKITADDWDVVTKGKVINQEEYLNGRTYTTIKFPIIQDDKTLLAGYTIDLTERKKMEEALRQSEEKYRLVANFTYDWESWHGPDGVYLYISPSCERITGYKAEEFAADPQLIVKITHPDDRASIIEHFGTTVGQFKQRDAIFDFRIITKDGRTRWINHTCTPVYDSNGKWMGRRESNRDVTARKQSESMLRARLRLSHYAESHSADESLQYALNEAEALTESQIGFFHAYDADQSAVMLQMWSSNTLQNFCSIKPERLHYALEKAGVWADCIRRREAVIYNDYPSLTRKKGTPEGHAELRRVLLAPVFQNDRIVAVIGVGNKQEEYDYQDVKIVQQIMELAWDVIQRKRVEDELRRAKDALEVALEREKKLSHTDSLTGIHNRRYLFELAEREFRLALRHNLPLSVVMFDIDFFKKVNDVFGHDAGDRALQSVVNAACAELRSSDVIGRYGGEEFVALLPMTKAAQALAVAERVRAKIEALRVPTLRGDISVTVSMGVVEFTPQGGGVLTVDDLVRFADEALYKAKNAGRNRVVLYGQK